MDLEKIREAAERVARSLGLEVVEVEWKVGRQRFLRVYIDRPAGPTRPAAAAQLGVADQAKAPGSPTGAGPAKSSGAGISHRECQAVSEQLSVILDVEDLVPGPGYILEVSSPGLDRKLRKPADFERFAGRLARISLDEPVENSKFFEGRLAGYADGVVRIEVKGRVVALPYASIRKANLVVEL